MFYAALALLQTTGKVPRRHRGVLSLFDTEFVLKGVSQKDSQKASSKPSSRVRSLPINRFNRPHANKPKTIWKKRPASSKPRSST
jgi:uncharacterized protein (UPF0332 family)